VPDDYVLAAGEVEQRNICVVRAALQKRRGGTALQSGFDHCVFSEFSLAWLQWPWCVLDIAS